MDSGDTEPTSTSSAVLATGGYDHTIKLWQPHSGICYWTGHHGESQVNSLAITPDKRRLAAAGFQHIRFYDISTTENVNSITNCEGVAKNVTCVGFQEDNKWMFTTGEDGSARIWDMRHGVRCYGHVKVNAPLNYGVLHPNQSELILCDENGVIYVWNLLTDSSEKLFSGSANSILCVAINELGSQLACVNTTGTCMVWDLNSRQNICGQIGTMNVINAHNKQALKCKFSPDNLLLATTSADQTARIWNLSDFSLVHELKVPNIGQRWVWDACFTDDSEYIITVSSDNIGRLWNLNNGKIEKEYIGHQKAITALAFRDK